MEGFWCEKTAFKKFHGCHFISIVNSVLIDFRSGLLLLDSGGFCKYPWNEMSRKMSFQREHFLDQKNVQAWYMYHRSARRVRRWGFSSFSLRSPLIGLDLCPVRPRHRGSRWLRWIFGGKNRNEMEKWAAEYKTKVDLQESDSDSNSNHIPQTLFKIFMPKVWTCESAPLFFPFHHISFGLKPHGQWKRPRLPSGTGNSTQGKSLEILGHFHFPIWVPSSHREIQHKALQSQMSKQTSMHPWQNTVWGSMRRRSGSACAELQKESRMVLDPSNFAPLLGPFLAVYRTNRSRWHPRVLDFRWLTAGRRKNIWGRQWGKTLIWGDTGFMLFKNWEKRDHHITMHLIMHELHGKSTSTMIILCIVRSIIWWFLISSPFGVSKVFGFQKVSFETALFFHIGPCGFHTIRQKLVRILGSCFGSVGSKERGPTSTANTSETYPAGQRHAVLLSESSCAWRSAGWRRFWKEGWTVGMVVKGFTAGLIDPDAMSTFEMGWYMIYPVSKKMVDLEETF